MLVIDNITDKESKYNLVTKIILFPHYYVYWLYLISCLHTDTHTHTQTFYFPNRKNCPQITHILLKDLRNEVLKDSYYWKQFGYSSKVWKYNYSPEISLLGMYPKELILGSQDLFAHHTHESTIHNSQEAEATKLSINR